MNQKPRPNSKQADGQSVDVLEPWDLSRTYTLVETVFGREQRAVVYPCLRSIVDRQNFARYHYIETERLLKRFQQKYLNGRHLLEVVHGGDERGSMAFERLMVKAGAHVTACIQAMHAVPDILASGVYFAVGLNRQQDALPDRRINIANVTHRLKREPGCADLAALLENVSSGDEYEHVAAVSNLSKHRTVIRASLNQDETGTRERLHEFHIMSFEKPTDRGVKHYPSISLADLVVHEFSRVSRLVIKIGHKIDETLELNVHQTEAPSRR